MKISTASQASLCLAALVASALQPARAGTLLQYDFTTPHAWSARTMQSAGLAATLQDGAFGTVDVANTSAPSGGLCLTAVPATGTTLPARWSTTLVSGLLPVASHETTAAKLTLSFQLSASSVRPVTVTVESFGANKQLSGALTAQIYPAAPNFYQRYALDLYSMKPTGAGSFRASDPFVQFRFGPSSSVAGLPAEPSYSLKLDDVNYASPAYFVSPSGSDGNDGRTEATAYANPQKALDVSQPGDIIDVMSGTYISPNGPSTSPLASGGLSPVANFTHPGTPAAWIVLKNYPGQHPTFFSNAWNIISLALGSSAQPNTGPPLAYLEIRGLHVRGEGDVVKTKYPDSMDKPDSRSNSNGIAIDSRYSALAHDIRIADNLVEYAPACGIGGDADWLTVENNVCNSNCWTNIYASSGISVSGPNNFDAQDNVYKRLIRNNVSCHNQNYEMWVDIGRYSDGNGIILDVNQGADPNQPAPVHPASNYIGRTLVQSNVCYDNGGSGIHTVTVAHADIVNNTVYLNSASVHLEYSEMFTYASKDVHFINNILVAPVANVAAGEKPEPVNQLGGDNTDVTFSHNVYFGGNIAPTLGDGDVFADPQFVFPSIVTASADFHLKAGSPAVGHGVIASGSPLYDLDGKRRSYPPSSGAYER